MERKSGLKRSCIVVLALLMLIVSVSFNAPVVVGEEIKPQPEVMEVVVPTEPKEPVTPPSEELRTMLQANMVELTYVEPASKKEAELGANGVDNYIHTLYTLLPPVHQTNLYLVGYQTIYDNVTAARLVGDQYKEDVAQFEAEEARKAAEEKAKKEAEKKKREEEKKKQEQAAANKNNQKDKDSNSTNKYGTATKVWKFMKEELGWNDYVCAGVMGNMMAECGGQTLALDYDLYDSTGKYYGICQWSKKYNKEIQGGGLTEQLNYLKKTVKKEIDNFGHKYKKGFDYNDFMNLQDAEEAALAFAKAYERCNSKHYSVRLVNAEKAYKYFVG
jgi:hypothetical protein